MIRQDRSRETRVEALGSNWGRAIVAWSKMLAVELGRMAPVQALWGLTVQGKSHGEGR